MAKTTRKSSTSRKSSGRRKPTAKQLQALKKGREKLAAMRRKKARKK